MRDAILRVLPADPPGMTFGELLDAVAPLLPNDRFPDRKTLTWYGRTVPNDMVVRGEVDYVPGAHPPRLHRVPVVAGPDAPSRCQPCPAEDAAPPSPT